jgi:hypothetical protein
MERGSKVVIECQAGKSSAKIAGPVPSYHAVRTKANRKKKKFQPLEIVADKKRADAKAIEQQTAHWVSPIHQEPCFKRLSDLPKCVIAP